MAYSIRGLLIITAFVAAACAALRYAGPVWWNILFIAAGLLFMAATVVAFVGKGNQRALAIGFAVCFAIYGAVVFLSPANELNVVRGRLPTTKVMRPIVESMAPPGRDDPVPTTMDSTMQQNVDTGFSIGVDFERAPTNTRPTFTTSATTRNGFPGVLPEHSDLLRIAHLLWAMLFGFLGSIFAGFVYRRNT